MKRLGNNEKRIIKDKTVEKVPGLVVEVVLVQCNLVNNATLHVSSVLYTFTPIKQFGGLIDTYILGKSNSQKHSAGNMLVYGLLMKTLDH